MTEEIEVWTRGQFPRGIAMNIGGRPIRMGYVVDMDEMIAFLRRNYMFGTYSNVFSMPQIEAGEFDVFFLDIDSHLYDPKTKQKYELSRDAVYERYRAVLDKLDDAGLTYRTYFSGRGFHVYVDFEPVVLADFGRVAIRYIHDVLGETFGYIDTRALVDKNRVARLPYTYNPKAKLFAIPIDKDWDIQTIVEKSREYEGKDQKLRRINISDELLEIDKKVGRSFGGFREWSNDTVPELYELIKDATLLPKCIRDSIKELVLTGELDHYRRLHLATFLLRVWSYDEVLDLMRLANDFNERMTRYQLDYILKRGILPYSCEKAKEMGICTAKNQEACIWYHLSNHWIGSIFVDKEKLMGDDGFE